MAKGGLGECFAACVQRGGSEFRRQVCVCVAEQWTSRDRAQLGRVGCVCVGGDSLCVLSVGSRGKAAGSILQSVQRKGSEFWSEG